jgi:hypothetical protein
MYDCITDKVFSICTGRDPIQDDLERCNCPLAGRTGHSACGWCEKHELPMFQCGCYIHRPTHYNEWDDVETYGPS